MNLAAAISVYAFGTQEGACKAVTTRGDQPGKRCGSGGIRWANKPRVSIGESHVVTMPLGKLLSNPVANREKIDAEKALLQSGQPVDPILAIPTPKDEHPYWVLDGSRRYQALKELGYANDDTVKVAVVSNWKNQTFYNLLAEKLSSRPEREVGRWNQLPLTVKHFMTYRGYRPGKGGAG